MTTPTEDIRIAKAMYRQQILQDGEPDVPLATQLEVIEDEVAYLCARLDAKGKAEKLAWGYVAARKKHLRAVVATIRTLHGLIEAPADSAAEGPQNGR